MNQIGDVKNIVEPELLPSGFVVGLDWTSRVLTKNMPPRKSPFVYDGCGTTVHIVGCFSATGKADSATIYGILDNALETGRTKGLAQVLRNLSGEFCFVTINPANRSVELCRSENGMEPLYVCQSETGIVCGNSVEMVSRQAGICGFDKCALLQYGLAEFITEPRTRYAGLTAVPRGSILAIKKGQEPRVESFLEPLSLLDELDVSIATLRTRYRESAVAAVQRRLFNTPAVYLSGGLDSNALAAYLVNDLGRRDTLALTFGVEGVSDDEVPIAAEVARHLGIEHHVLMIDPKEEFDLASYLRRMNVFDPSALMISRLAKSGGAYAGNKLTIFGGQDHRLHTPFLGRMDQFFLSHVVDYPWLLMPIRVGAKIAIRMINFDRKMKRAVEIAASARGVSDVLAMRFLKLKPAPVAASMLGVYKCADSYANDINASLERSRPNLRSRFNAVVDVWYQGQLLSDALYMRDSTEIGGQYCAMPYLDSDFVKFCARIPYSIAAQKMEGRDGFDLDKKTRVDKAFLRSTLVKDFPERLLLRKKAIMPSLHLFFNGAFRPYLLDMMKKGGIWETPLGEYIDRTELTAVLKVKDKCWTADDPGILYYLRNLMCVDAHVRHQYL